MKTILVVDDERPIVEMLQTLLEEEGYRVLSAANGQQGLDRMAEQPPDVVISDVMMPVCDGREMARRMRADPALRAIPVIMMTAGNYVNIGDQRHYAGVLVKPFDIQRLLDMIVALE